MSPEEEEELPVVVPPISLKFEVPEFDRIPVWRIVYEDGSAHFRTEDEIIRLVHSTPEERARVATDLEALLKQIKGQGDKGGKK